MTRQLSNSVVEQLKLQLTGVSIRLETEREELTRLNAERAMKLQEFDARIDKQENIVGGVETEIEGLKNAIAILTASLPIIPEPAEAPPEA